MISSRAITTACMFRCILVILVGLGSFLIGATRAPAQAEDLPSVSIVLPTSVPSESVQISYYLVGGFGGYRGYVARQFGVTSYQIPTVVQGKAANEFRAIVYASGCEIQRLVIPLSEQSRASREFVCQPVETVRLSGQIVPNELARYGNAEVVFTYMARWAHGFFGITDGFVTHFELAKMSPQADGRFDVNLPLISQEATEPQASMFDVARFQNIEPHRFKSGDRRSGPQVRISLFKNPQLLSNREEVQGSKFREKHSQRQSVPLGFRATDFKFLRLARKRKRPGEFRYQDG